MKILSVVGARPQFVKLAAISRGIERLQKVGHDLQHTIVHTGQHYDVGMSDVFFNDLQIPMPDVNLAIGSAGHGAQTGRMLEAIEQVLINERPDWTLVYGDTNSTLAGALASTKLHLPVAHLEAGLRSFNRRMPEEINRILTDHAADLLLAPTTVASGHLANEGLADRTVVTGDVMADVCLSVAASVSNDPTMLQLPEHVDPDEPYFVATIHRAENTDGEARLRQIISGLQALDRPVVLFAHPRLVQKAADARIDLDQGQVNVAAPAPYPQLIAAVQRSAGVITDSGGLQKEAYILGIPCTTVRTETEWIETLADGWNVLVTDLTLLASSASRPRPCSPQGSPYGHGDASEKSVQALIHADRA